MNDLFADDIVELARGHAKDSPQEFLDWLPENLTVWNAFVEQTFLVIKKGFKHYSSYTIVEFLRHHTAVAEGGSEWKINNNHRPYLSRLFDLRYPQHAGLFEYRTTTKVKAG